MKTHLIVNVAMSLDGYITNERGRKTLLSNHKDLVRVHELRASVDGVMVGINTVLVDDPQLTVRDVAGRNPARIVVDSNARIPLEAKLLEEEGDVILLTTTQAENRKLKKLQLLGVDLVKVGEDRVDLKEGLFELSQRGIRKILVEGGATLITSMLEEKLVDELYVTVAPQVFGGGVPLFSEEFKSKVKLDLDGIKQLDDQVVLHYMVKK
ncbi:2,5-diamino-6-(ribosylamino)-4(3H)-pyrimidinone 5'-phosphate reductase [Candidatus Altiarchaeota archaeon]